MRQQSALNKTCQLSLALAMVAVAGPALADDPIIRSGADLGPLAHSNQGRGGSFIDSEFQLPFAPGDPTKIKRIDDSNKIYSFSEPIGRDNFQAPMSSGLQGIGQFGQADEISDYIGPTSYSTPVPAPGGIVLVLGVGLFAARRRR